MAPYMTRPTLRGVGVRDTSLTDFAGSFLLVFFYPSDWEHQEDLLELSQRARQWRKAGCEVVACSTDSCMVHKAWSLAPREEGGLGGTEVPLMEDRKGELASALQVYNEEEGVCHRAVLLIDDKSVVRHLATSSLGMGDLLDSSLAALAAVREAGGVRVEERGRRTSFLDKLWRGSLKPPKTPTSSLHSAGRSLSRGGEEGGVGEVIRRRGRSRSKSRSSRRGPSVAQPVWHWGGEERCTQLAEEVVVAVRRGLQPKLASSIPLPDYSAGEVCLGGGRVQGLGRLALGQGATLAPRHGHTALAFPLQVSGVSASYSLSGRRLEGELTFSYSTLTYTARLTQDIGAELTERLQLVDLELQAVEGGKMEVRGLGPLNWLAGRKVSDLVQETLLQEVEEELRAGLEQQLSFLSLYYQAVEREAPGLVPVGVLAH